MSDVTNYARAIFEKAVEKYGRDLHALNSAVDKSNLLTRLDNPSESFEGKKALLNGMLPPNADNEVRNLAYLLASKNQVHLIGEIVSAFDRLVTAGAPSHTARVTTTIELNSEERGKLESKLRAQYGKELLFDYRLDPEILGGVVVRIGDVVIDGSVAGKLAVMKQKMETAR
ncbi:MAG: ATP synthase F1 subunit delta [Chloroflexota bacterium]|nr:MAG: ATP synthase F1 subunit delta [Chloroflexota bacterium]